MQTKKIVGLIMILFAATKVPAQLKMDVSPGKTANSFIVKIQNPEKKKLNLQISHQMLGTAVDTTIASEAFSQQYNMENADDGQYLVLIRCGKEKISRELELSTVQSRSIRLQ